MNIDERLNNLENKINILSQNLNNSNKRLFGFEKIIIIIKNKTIINLTILKVKNKSNIDLNNPNNPFIKAANTTNNN